MNERPLVTIITVCYNAIITIEDTILSVLNQTYDNIEYIIIDGDSKDGTTDIIKKYKNEISLWISEPDKGIYDAMNKGIHLAKGKWINFMNCGDSFYSVDTIKQIADGLSFNEQTDVIYGNCVININDRRYMVIPENLKCISNHLPFCHQCTFVKASLAKTYPFDLNYKFVADYNFFYHMYKKGHPFLYINIPIANYQIEDGFTASNMNLCFAETFKVNGNKLSFLTRIQYNFKAILLNTLPEYLITLIRRIRYKYNPLFTEI